MRYLILALLLVLFTNLSFSQWNVNGTGLPEHVNFVSPSIQYSAFHNKHFVLTRPSFGSSGTTYRMDTMHIQNDTWALLDSSLLQDKFVARQNGELVFATVTSGEIELIGTDELGSFLWSNVTSGLGLQGSDILHLHEGKNNDLYVQYDDIDTSVLFKFENNTWTHLSSSKGKLQFFTNGSPVCMDYLDDLTTGLESRTYWLETYNGTNWISLDSATVPEFHTAGFLGYSVPDFSISKLDSIYIVDN